MSFSAVKLSAVVITFNEAKNIARCLESLDFCSQIVVVDSESVDGTAEIARRYTPHVHTRPWPGYSSQKNYANSLASHEWILSLDADEQVSAELRSEIEGVLASEPAEDGFLIPRKTIHLGRWIRYGGWYPNRLVRLFKKGAGAWIGSDVHERWEASGAVGVLKGHILHYSFENIADQVARNNGYSTLGAQKLSREGRRFTLTKMLVKPFAKFVETYFLKRGFLDRCPGFIISISAAYSVFLKWAKLWELERREKKS